jgi:hypothetical protein
MARIDLAFVDDGDDIDRPSGIVLASDSAKIPPPHPTSRYRNPPVVDSDDDASSLVANPFCAGGDSARQEAIKSCRRGFIRCSTRDGPIGSHQLLASPEKCESSSAETEDEECDDGKDECFRRNGAYRLL